MNITEYCLIMFFTQLVFIWARTLNVKYISKNDTKKALLSGSLVHLSWLVSIAIGSYSMYEVINNFKFEYTPIILCSLTGGLIGTYIALKNKKNNK